MSRTLDLLADVAIHGTVAGYRAGCRGGHCPAEFACRDVNQRYAGDWGFRKRVDAGEMPVSIMAAEVAEAEAVRERDRIARAAAKREAALKHRAKAQRERAARKPKTPKVPRVRRSAVLDRLRDDVTRLHGEGLSDVAIGRELGEPVSTIQYVRAQRLGLPRNYRAKAGRTPSERETRQARVRELHAEGKTDREIGAALGITMPAANQMRRRLGLTVNPERTAKPRPSKGERVDHRPEIARLRGEGMSDGEIGDALGIATSTVNRLRNELGLPPIRKARSKWEGVELAGHGTNACWARGCRRDECVEAHREYHREYAKRRRIEGAREHHGTAYGYQLGCRGSSCPSTPSCTTAMLDADRARRRAAGVPAKELVDAAPVRAHVQDLVASGMTTLQVAEAADVPFSAVKSVLFSRGVGRPRVESLLAERAIAILAVELVERAA